MRRSGRLSRTRLQGVVLAAISLLCGGLLVAAAPSATAVESFYLPTSGTVTVIGHGNGHGHGLSQYGARGAALANLSPNQILAFYYPGTSLVTFPAQPVMRVLLSDTTANTTVRVATGLALVAPTGASLPGVPRPLPTGGTSRYRLVPSGAGLRLDSLTNNAWRTVADGLPAQAYFRADQGFVSVDLSDGGSADYRGSVGAVRSGSGELSVNRLLLDDYTIGVVPREMPASWPTAAVRAQAVAVRSYGEYEREHAGTQPYDICDTTMCQVYGGMRRYDAAGNLLWSDDPSAIVGNQDTVLQYQGQTIFAQFSASNGGWTVDGGFPYLPARQDPYDNAQSQDPYLNWSRSVSVGALANSFGMARVTRIDVVQRDGNGEWGGRVLQATVYGVNGSGRAVSQPVSGFTLAGAFGAPTNWLTVDQLNPTTPQGRYVASLYLLLLGRTADASGLAHWTAQLVGGSSPAVVASSIALSAEGRSRYVDWLYYGYFSRLTDPVGQRTWTTFLANGGRAVDLESRLVSSNEFWTRSGSSNRGYVDALYTNPLLVNGAVDPAGETYWVGQLASGVSRSYVAYRFLVTGTTVGNRVQQAYATVLGRPATSADISASLPGYRASNYNYYALLAAVASSPEFLSRFGL